MRVRWVCAVIALAGVASATPAGVAGPSAGPSAGADESPVTSALRRFAAAPALKDAQVGIVVMDAESGEVLGQVGEHLALNPASNAKLYTAAAALALLRASYRYQTTVTGTVQASTVAELTLHGQGDPSLRTEDFVSIAQELKSRGIRRVEGIAVDQSFFDEQTTPPAFDQQPNEWAAFRAPVSAVAVNENTVTMSVRPTQAGSPAIVTFDPPGFVDVTGAVRTGQAGADTVRLDLDAAGSRLAAKVSGTVGADARLVRYTRRVDSPQLLAGFTLKSALEGAGVAVAGTVRLGAPKGTLLARHESEPLSTLLYALGKTSDNFAAEMVFKSLGPHTKARPGKSEDAAAIVTTWIESNGLGDSGVSIRNGSGLYDANRVTAMSVVKLLRYAWQDPGMHAEFLAQLAIGGVDGTLHKRFRGIRAQRAIRAKTGTLEDAIALSGYVLAPPGKHALVFSVLCNHVSGRGAAVRNAVDALVEALHKTRWST